MKERSVPQSYTTNLIKTFNIAMLIGILIGAGSVSIGLMIVQLIITSQALFDIKVLISCVLGFIFLIASWALSKISLNLLKKCAFNIPLHVIRKNLKILLLIDFLIILFSIAYVLDFNILNMLWPHNQLLIYCVKYCRKISDRGIIVLTGNTVLLIIITNLCIILSSLYFSLSKENKTVKRLLRIVRMVVNWVIILTIITIAMDCLLLYKYTEDKYAQTLIHFKNVAIMYDNETSGISCIWNFVIHYKLEFISTYRLPCPKPRQLLIRVDSIYNRDFVAKLCAICKTGACLDFALGVTKLIEDLYGYETRVVKLKGQDHAIPEVRINGTWYVIDAVYTTQNYPVKASKYVRYLQRYYPEVYKNLRGLVDFDTGKDLSDEHGF